MYMLMYIDSDKCTKVNDLDFVPVTIRVRKLCHFGQKIEFVTATKNTFISK